VLIDIAGRRVRTLVNGPVGAGSQEVAWDGRGNNGARVAAGVYWARLDADGETAVRRLARIAMP
jgi:flagellar hook assembly protein FlgD